VNRLDTTTTRVAANIATNIATRVATTTSRTEEDNKKAKDTKAN